MIDPNSKEAVHVTELPHITEENVAFISYIINSYVTVPLHELYCMPIDEKFMQVKAGAIFRFRSSESNHYLEFWLITDNGGKPMSLAQREVMDGEVVKHSTGLTQFIMRPYHMACVQEGIENLPVFEDK